MHILHRHRRFDRMHAGGCGGGSRSGMKTARGFPPPWSGEVRLLSIKLLANIHPNNRGVDRHRLAQQQAALQSDRLWQSCIAHKRCHILLAVSHRRREHSLFPQHCLRLTQYRRQLPRQFPYVPPLIQVQHLPERLVRCQRQRCQLQRHSPPGRGIGSLSLAKLMPGSTDRHPGKTHKTCSGRAWLRMMERLDRYRRSPHT